MLNSWTNSEFWPEPVSKYCAHIPHLVVVFEAKEKDITVA